MAEGTCEGVCRDRFVVHDVVDMTLTGVSDIAAVSVDQARLRWTQIRTPRFDAQFAALDCYTVRGPSPNHGPSADAPHRVRNQSPPVSLRRHSSVPLMPSRCNFACTMRSKAWPRYA